MPGEPNKDKVEGHSLLILAGNLPVAHFTGEKME
jgi:hypothetical protein